MSNKELATSFLKMAATGDVRAAYDKFIAKDFIHHNQYFKGDRNSLMVAMEEANKTTPNKLIDIKMTLEDGDKVMTLSRVERKDPSEQEIAVVHIFRFEKDRIIELWDLGQIIERNSPNENSPF